MRNLNAIFFLKNFTIQTLGGGGNSADTMNTNTLNTTFVVDRASDDLENMKTLRILPEAIMREELNRIFGYAEMSRHEIKTTTTFQDVDLRCIELNKNLNFSLYYFATNDLPSSMATGESIPLKKFFNSFMNCGEIRYLLHDKIFTIFMHLVNLYEANVIL